MIQSVNESATGTTSSAAAVEIAYDMAPRFQYRITAKGAPLWFSVIATGGAAATVGGATSHFLFTGESVLIGAIGGGGADLNSLNQTAKRNRVSIIRDGATDASAILSQLVQVQSF